MKCTVGECRGIRRCPWKWRRAKPESASRRCSIALPGSGCLPERPRAKERATSRRAFMPASPSLSERSRAGISSDRKTYARKSGKSYSNAMAASILADTGAILAILDRDDGWHRRCVDALKRIPLPFLTSEAVLTELFYLTSGSSYEVERAWKFVRSGYLTLAPIADAELPSLHALMSRYADRPMDFADAT